MNGKKTAPYRIGVDENGLGARLGPLLVTAVLARVDEGGARLLSRKLPEKLRRDLDDSKALVSCHDVSLGEAWARALFEREHPDVTPRSPAELFTALSLHGEEQLQGACPPSTKEQCWTQVGEAFQASDEQLERTRGHLRTLEARGVDLLLGRSSWVCTGKLNELKARGINRFSADLHEMERLVLELRRHAGHDVWAVCGKVGGMGQYGRFFGPLSGRLHTPLVEGAAESAYHFPGLGTLAFVRDADASDPLVMLASLVGKYFRELSMRRISTYYRTELGAPEDEFSVPSGYHDPVTRRFVDDTTELRTRLRILTSCFERSRDEAAAVSSEARAGARAGEARAGKVKLVRVAKATNKKPAPSDKQIDLFSG